MRTFLVSTLLILLQDSLAAPACPSKELTISSDPAVGVLTSGSNDEVSKKFQELIQKHYSIEPIPEDKVPAEAADTFKSFQHPEPEADSQCKAPAAEPAAPEPPKEAEAKPEAPSSAGEDEAKPAESTPVEEPNPAPEAVSPLPSEPKPEGKECEAPCPSVTIEQLDCGNKLIEAVDDALCPRPARECFYHLPCSSCPCNSCPCNSCPCNSCPCCSQPCPDNNCLTETIVKPCYQDVYTTVPAVKKFLTHKIVHTVRHVPVPENIILPQHEQLIRHVPVVQKVRRTIVDYVTRSVPVIRHRNRTIFEFYTEHVPITENSKRTVVDSLLKKVPILMSHVKPVIHEKLRHVPVVVTRYRPEIHETITNVPVKQKFIKNVEEYVLKPCRTPCVHCQSCHPATVC